MKRRELEQLEQRLKSMDIPRLNELPLMIRQRQDQTYAMLDSLKIKASQRRPQMMKRALIGFGAAVILGVVVLGSGFASPAMANTLGRIALVNSIFEMAGDLGLRLASQKGLTTAVNVSDQHDEIKIAVNEVIYDGTRLSVALKRSGGDFKGSFQGLRLNPDGTTKTDLDGKPIFNTIEDTGESYDLQIFIDGKPLNPDENEEDSFKHSISPIIMSGSDEQSMIMLFAEKTYVEGGLILPDQFQMTIKTKLTGMPDDEFILDIPVKKDSSHNVVLQPEQSRTYNRVTTTVQKVTLAPSTTQIRINDQAVEGFPAAYLQGHDLELNHDIYDDKGNRLEMVNGGGGWSEPVNKDNTVKYSLVSDVNVAPLESDVKYITIKTYLYKYIGTGREKRNLLDSSGFPVVEYIPRLEMTIPVR